MARSDERAAVLIVERSTYRFLEQDFAVPGYGEHVWTLADLKRLLAAQGLHVVTDAEMAVLGAMGKLPLRCLESVRDGDSALHPMVHPPLLAELARREAKHGQ